MSKISKIPTKLDFKVHGQRGVLIQLLEYPEQTTKSESGIYMPKYKAYETDGGRPAAAIDSEVYSLVGKVLQISDKAKEIMDEEKMGYTVGSFVSIAPHAKTRNNWFIEDKLQQVADFTGKLLLTPSQIECEITNLD